MPGHEKGGPYSTRREGLVHAGPVSLAALRQRLSRWLAGKLPNARILKLQPDRAIIQQAGRRLFVKIDEPRCILREWPVLAALSTHGVAPLPVAFDAAAGFLVESYAPDGPLDGAAVGSALAAVHAAGIDLAGLDDVQDEYLQVRRQFVRAAAAARGHPDARPILARVNAGLLESARKAARACQTLPACLIHGDLTPGNIRCANGQAVLIDWECARRSSPLLDLALVRLLLPLQARAAVQAYARRRSLDAAALSRQIAMAAPLAALIEAVEALEDVLRGKRESVKEAVFCLDRANALLKENQDGRFSSSLR